MNIIDTVKWLSGIGAFSFGFKLIRTSVKKYRESAKQKEKDRKDFQLLLQEVGEIKQEVGEIKSDVTSVKVSINSFTERQRTYLNLQNVAFYETNSEGEYVYVSPALTSIYKQPEQRIMGNGWYSLISDDYRHKVINNWVYSMEEMFVFDEIYLLKGSKTVVHNMAFHRKDADGKYAGSFGQVKIYENN
jgi:PAS domain-containing protein